MRPRRGRGAHPPHPPNIHKMRTINPQPKGLETAPTDNSYLDLIAQIKVELTLRKESLFGDRVQRWCNQAGYPSIHHVPPTALEKLLTAIKKTPIPKTKPIEEENLKRK